MRTIKSKASAQITAKLEHYLTKVLPANVTDFSVHGIRSLDKQGRSTFMYSFFGTFDLEGNEQTKEFILRIYKNENDSQNGHKEFTILNALKEQNLPVPKVYYFDKHSKVFGKPFMIMETIRGKDASNYITDDKTSQNIVNKMAKVLVDIHKVDLKHIENSKILRQQYERKQQLLSDARRFISERCPKFLGFSPPYQRRFIAAVKKLPSTKPEKVCSALLHLDYEPNHILVLDGHCIVIDWGEASIGDPAYDVAWTYHKLRLERENAKVDLGKYFVKCYEEYSGQKLVNLQLFKDNVAIEMVKWSGLLPFYSGRSRNYVRLLSIFFGDFVGEFKRAVYTHRKKQVMEGHHTNVWTKNGYIKKYALRYLEKDRYKITD